MIIKFGMTPHIYNSQFPGENLYNTLNVTSNTVTHWIWLWFVVKKFWSIRNTYCAVCWKQVCVYNSGGVSGNWGRV